MPQEIRVDSPFTQEDLSYIESQIYEVPKHELVARRVARVNTSFDPDALFIKYYWFNPRGSAKVLRAGANANDIPVVGLDGGSETVEVYDIATALRHNLQQRKAFQMARKRGVNADIDTMQMAGGGRFVAESENRLFFIGDSKLGIKGLLNHPGITAEDIAPLGTGATDPEKRLFNNMTGEQILQIVKRGRKASRQGGLFRPNTILISPDCEEDLDGKLMTGYTDVTVLEWLQKKAKFTKWIATSAMSAGNNGFATDCFCIIDDNPLYIELGVIQEMMLYPPVYDIMQNADQALVERCVGAIIRHPGMVYVGKGC
jgi:hypothetical protein